MNVRSSNLDNVYTNGEQYEEEIKKFFNMDSWSRSLDHVPLVFVFR